MRDPQSRIRLYRLITAASLPVWLMFIFSNSMRSGRRSSRQSRRVAEAVGFIPEFLIRKAGHLGEFFVFGLLVRRFFLVRRERGKFAFPAAFSFGIAAAVRDETIQAFVPGRQRRLYDVCIDCAGFAIGVFAVLLFSHLVKKER